MQPQLEDSNLLKDHLLGRTTREKQNLLDKRFFTDDEFYELMLAAEDDLIDDYVRGKLSPEERGLFKHRFLCTEEQRRRVEFARVVAETSRKGGLRPQVWSHLSDFVRSMIPAPGWGGKQISFALASLFLVVLLSGVLMQALLNPGQLARYEPQNEQGHVARVSLPDKKPPLDASGQVAPEGGGGAADARGVSSGDSPANAPQTSGGGAGRERNGGARLRESASNKRAGSPVILRRSESVAPVGSLDGTLRKLSKEQQFPKKGDAGEGDIVATLTLRPPSLLVSRIRADRSTPTLSLPEEGDRCCATVTLQILLDEAKSPSYRAVIRMNGVGVIKTLAGLKAEPRASEKVINVNVPAKEFAPGDYFLELTGEDETGVSKEYIQHYSFRVESASDP